MSNVNVKIGNIIKSEDFISSRKSFIIGVVRVVNENVIKFDIIKEQYEKFDPSLGNEWNDAEVEESMERYGQRVTCANVDKMFPIDWPTRIQVLA